MINAGKYDKVIKIYERAFVENSNGFPTKTDVLKLTAHAYIKTTKGYTLIKNNADFESAYTNFTIRFPKTEIKRKYIIKYSNREYTIEYLNNVDLKCEELEIQAKEIAVG